MKILYYGTVCDLQGYERLLSRCSIKPSIATIVFETALLEGFAQNGADVEIISCPMISNWRDSKLFYWGRKQEKLTCGYTCTWLRTCNVMFLKQISRCIDGRKAIKQWLRENGGETCVILSYGVSPFLTKEIIRLSRKYGVKTCAIVPDLPRDMFLNSSVHTFKAWLRQKYLKPTLRIQGKYDGYVYLTEAMSQIINPNKPYIVMEGIMNGRVSLDVQEKKSDPRAIMYAGGLNEKYGVLNLIDAFESAALSNTELWLFGDGNAVERIKARAERNPAIRFWGRRDRDEILAYEKRATLLVNPRSTKDDFTKYSFPSKTIEYMQSGTPLLTTKLQGIPDEYFEYVFSVENNDPFALCDAIKAVMQLPETELAEMGLRASRFVEEIKNPQVQSRRIITFLLELVEHKNEN